LIEAGSLTLDNRASISAATASGEGGNLTLQIEDILLLRHNSLISAEAGGTGNGGNITIDTDFIVAVPEENSDIVANAFQGRGGNINITAQGIFGTQFRPRLTPLSDITASSELGVDGVVAINTPNVDPSQGLAELPTNLVDATGLVDRSCTPGSGATRSSFTVTGRGGLPSNPTEPLNSDAVLADWVTLDSQPENPPSAASDANPSSSPPEQIVEAQGWIKTPDGQVILTAESPTVTPHTPRLTSLSCQSSQTATH
jgi:large exoprotein involved in heme utilization and adhesion